jgi:hypothetical protein
MKKKMQNCCVRLLLGLLFLVSSVAYGSDAKRGAGMIELSGLQLRACAVALEDFKPRGFLLEHYKIIIVDRPVGHEVVFVPEHPKGQATLRGGATAYGKEIHYTISPSGRIESVSFAR